MAKKQKEIFMSNKEMVKTSSNLPAAAKSMDGFAAFDFDAGDFNVPRVSAMVGQSKLVANREAQQGEFRSSNGELLGDLDKPFEFIPFHVEKIFYVHDDKGSGQKGDWIRTEAYDGSKPRTSMENGKAIVRFKAWKIFFILPGHLKAGRAAFPYHYSLGSSSGTGAAQEIVMQMYAKNAALGGNPASHVMTMGGRWKEKAGQAPFVVYIARPKRLSSSDELKEAVKWAKMVASGQAKAEEEAETEGE